MLYSDTREFLFIHNPKAAGTSIRQVLAPFDDSAGLYWHPFYVDRLSRIVDRAHICANELEDFDLLQKAAKYFTFGFVRDPYERFMSAWDEHLHQHGESDEPFADPNEWIRQHLIPANVRYDWRYIHFCPQHFFFYRGRKCIVDYLGRFERIKDDWLSIQRIININAPLASTNNRRSSMRDAFFAKLNHASIERINEIYERDFELFGYEKLLTSDRLHFKAATYLERVESGLIPERRMLRDQFESNQHKIDELEASAAELNAQLQAFQSQHEGLLARHEALQDEACALASQQQIAIDILANPVSSPSEQPSLENACNQAVTTITSMREILAEKDLQLDALRLQANETQSALDITNRQLESTKQELDSVSQKLSMTLQQHDATLQERDATLRQHDATLQQLESTSQQLNMTTHQLDATKQQLDDATLQLNAVDQQRETVARELDAVMHSKSWRYTIPVRSLLRKFR